MVLGIGRKKSEEELFIEDIKSLISFLNNDTYESADKVNSLSKKLRQISGRFLEIEKNSLNRVVEIIPILLKYQYISKANFNQFVTKHGGINEPDFLRKLRANLINSIARLEELSLSKDVEQEVEDNLRPTLIKTVVFINFLIKLDGELQSIESKVLK